MEKAAPVLCAIECTIPRSAFENAILPDTVRNASVLLHPYCSYMMPEDNPIPSRSPAAPMDL